MSKDNKREILFEICLVLLHYGIHSVLDDPCHLFQRLASIKIINGFLSNYIHVREKSA